MKLAWFISPKSAILWIGVSGKQYPHSCELQAVSFDFKAICDQNRSSKPHEENKALKIEAMAVMKYFSLNEHYYMYDTNMKWSQI